MMKLQFLVLSDKAIQSYVKQDINKQQVEFLFQIINIDFLTIQMQLEWLALIIPCSYYLISTFFLIFPNILHKRMKYSYESDMLLCIGHRGGSWQGPENTVEIFKDKDHLLHMFQLDVCLTKDGQLVVHHDNTLTRLCGKNLVIEETNYQDFPQYLPLIQALGGVKVETRNNRVPLLDKVFEAFPQKPMNIQLKTPSDSAILQFSRLVNKHNREHITVWGVAGGKNYQLRQSSPSVINFYSAGQILKIYLLFLTGLLPFVCIRQGVVDIPLATSQLYKMAMKFMDGNCLKMCLCSCLYGVLSCFNFMSRLWIPHLKKRGILTFYFILNQDEDFQTAISTGCSGIMTDLPTKLNSVLKKKGLFYIEQNSF